MKAFFEQQVAEKGKVQMMAEALLWAVNNKLVTVETLKSQPIEEQQRELVRLALMYSQSLMLSHK